MCVCVCLAVSGSRFSRIVSIMANWHASKTVWLVIGLIMARLWEKISLA